MLLVGTHISEGKGLVAIQENDLTRHLAVVGQSGSGKSFFLARYLEELVLRTRARVVVLDPNGDFRGFGRPRESVWATSPFNSHLEELQEATPGDSSNSFDRRSTFSRQWLTRRFQYVRYHDTPPWDQMRPGDRLTEDDSDEPATEDYEREGERGSEKKSRSEARRSPGKPPSSFTRTAATTPQAIDDDIICIHWWNIERVQKFLLQLDPVNQPRVYLAYEVCRKHLDAQREYAHGFGLRELEDTALRFASNTNLRRKTVQSTLLSEEDYMALKGKVAELRSRFSVFYDTDMEHADWAPTDLPGFLKKPFRSRDVPWQVCVIGLRSAPRSDMLLSAEVTLETLLSECKRQWEWALDHDRTDTRVPTFVVIDEIQNFSPRKSQNRLQQKVSDKIAEIAAEGRKYGLFLVAATQRPQKLREGLLDECDNACLLRIQSKHEREAAAASLGLPAEVVDLVAGVKQGEGMMAGRWVPSPFLVKFAPARTVVGGGGLNIDHWSQPLEEAVQLDWSQLASQAVVDWKEGTKGVGENRRARLIGQTKAILSRFAEHDEARKELEESGLGGPTLGEIFPNAVEDFEPLLFGFSKLGEFLQFACSGTELCMYSLPPYEIRMGHRESPLEEFEQLPDLEPRELHSEETYRTILETSLPLFKLPDPRIVDVVMRTLLEERPVEESVGGLIERSVRASENSARDAEVKNGVLALVAADAFIRRPDDAALADQNLTLREEIQSREDLERQLRDAVTRKIVNRIGEVDNEILSRLMDH